MVDPTLGSLLEEHRQVTHWQKEELEARMKELGKEPSGKGFFAQILTRIWESLTPAQDDLDKLLRSFGTEHFEIAMYQALESYARAIGDNKTAELAARHLTEEQETAARLRPLIAPTAAQIAVGSPEPVVTETPEPVAVERSE
ncbi:MAG: ferritin-like domain-containing protein [Gemmataceae bacterium]|nr:ferritin-like domain-containing protein [Gemmataceae bacterium]